MQGAICKVSVVEVIFKRVVVVGEHLARAIKLEIDPQQTGEFSVVVHLWRADFFACWSVFVPTLSGHLLQGGELLLFVFEGLAIGGDIAPTTEI